MLFAQGRFNKNILVMKVFTLKQLAKYRVVKGFCQLCLRVESQKRHIMLLHLLPQRFV